MKHNYPKFFVITLLFALSLNLTSFGQELVLEMPFEKQVSLATQIVEGKVIAKKAHWNSDRTFIYTVSTIEVYKVFKGQNLSNVHIVTPGGVLDGQGINVNPSLKLHLNEIGVFILNNGKVTLTDYSLGKLFKPNGSIQGFYRYDVIKNVYANTFNWNTGISKNLYRKIINDTGRDYIEIKKFDIEKLYNDIQRQSAPNDITSISPLTTSGGTGDVLTISGSGFGNTNGTISFPNPNNGGTSYLDAYDTHIVSWTDTEILIEVPSFAGTGTVRVRTADENLFFSDELTVAYAHINVEFTNATTPEEFKTQLYARDGNGGYDWKYNSNINNNEPAKTAFENAFFNWVCSTGVNWRLDGVTALRPNIVGEPADGSNVVGFRDDVDDDPSDGTTIAYAISRYIFCSDFTGSDIAVEDTDIVYNSDLNFNYGPGNPVGSQIDFETVSLHELGHAHQLGHIIDPGALMHFAVNGGNAVRNFEPNDITGGTAVFNRSANDQICSLPVMTASACSLSTEDLLMEALSVYPNPAKTVLNIKAPAGIEIENINFIDARGRVVLNKDMKPETLNKINVSSLSNGIYFLRINTESSSITKKVIIQ